MEKRDVQRKRPDLVETINAFADEMLTTLLKESKELFQHKLTDSIDPRKIIAANASRDHALKTKVNLIKTIMGIKFKPSKDRDEAEEQREQEKQTEELLRLIENTARPDAAALEQFTPDTSGFAKTITELDEASED
jgi:hypothetical protein